MLWREDEKREAFKNELGSCLPSKFTENRLMRATKNKLDNAIGRKKKKHDQSIIEHFDS